MPPWAIYRHDVRALASSWLVRLWLAATAVLTLLVLAVAWNQQPTTVLIATLVFPYLILPWSLVVMVLSVRPVAGAEAEAVADGLLSRPVTRYEYMLASWAARTTVVLAVYLGVVLPAVLLVCFADRPVAGDAPAVYGTIAGLGLVGLVLTFLVSIGFFLGTLLRNQWLAVIVLVFLWLPVNGILDTFSLEEISPISLTRALPTLLQRPWKEPDEKMTEEPPDLKAVAEEATRFFAFLGGSPPPKPKPKPKPRQEEFFDPEAFQDVRVSRLVLGYGLPTVLALSLAIGCFCLRDL